MDTNESSLPFVLQYVNAPCGSGKTYQIIQALLALYQSGSTGKCFYVAPTVALVEQTHKELVWLKVPTVSIYLEKLNETQTVRSEIFKAMRGHKGFLVLCVTYAGFEGTAVELGEATKSFIEVYCDEIPKVDRYERMLLPYRYKELLLPLVEAIDCPQETLVELVCKNIGLVKEIARRNTDDGDAPIKELTRELVKGYRVFTLRSQWEKLVSDHVDNDCHGLHTHKNALDVVVMHNIGIYKGFKKVIFYGANADKTLFLEYHRCKSDISIEDITDQYATKLRYLEHPNGDKLKIVYVFPHRIWSKAKANSYYDDNSVMTQNEEFVTSAADYVAKLGVPYGYVCNNNSHNNPNIEELFKKHFPTGQRIPVRSHGSNDYDDLPCIVMSPWLNVTPVESILLQLIGLSFEHQTMDLTHGTYYQGMMRGSLRNPDCQDPFTFIVPVIEQAKVMASFFTKGVTIQSIDGRVSMRTKGVERLSAKDEERRRQWRESQRALSHRGIFVQEGEVEDSLGVNQRVSEKDSFFGNPLNRPQNNPYSCLDLRKLAKKHGLINGIRLFARQKIAIDKALGVYDKDPPPPPPELNYGIKIFRNKFDPSGGNAGTPISLDNVVWFAEFIRHWNENTFIPSKDKNFLFSPALFKDGATTRTQDDVEAVQAVVLDIEGGIEYDKAIELFKKKFAFCIHTSYSHDPDNGDHRFRMIFFVDRLMDVDSYYIVRNYILNQFLYAGYWIGDTKQYGDYAEQCKAENREPKPNAGLDHSKAPANSLFYMYAKNPMFVDAARFDKFNLTRHHGRDSDIKLIDVEKVCAWYEFPTFVYDKVIFEDSNSQGNPNSSEREIYNQNHDFSVLEQWGYQQDGHSNRWMTPDSTTGSPGVLVNPDRNLCVIFHGSDRYAMSKEKKPNTGWVVATPFDLFVFYECNNDYSLACKKVRESMGNC